MTCLQLANQIGLFFFIHNSLRTHFHNSHAPIGLFHHSVPRRVLRVYWLGYLPGTVFRERVSGASSLVCTGLFSLDISAVMQPLMLIIMSGPFSLDISATKLCLHLCLWFCRACIHLTQELLCLHSCLWLCR